MNGIIEGLLPLARDLGEMKLLPGNPSKGDVGAVAVSLEAFGQVKPIVVNADGFILAGNTTYKAAKSLGWNQVAAVTVAMDEQTGKAYALTDNRTRDLAVYDDQMLAEMLVSIQDDTDLLLVTSYVPDDISDLLAGLHDSGIDTVMNRDTPQERQELYESSGIRSVIIPVATGDYKILIGQLAELQTDMGLGNNAEVILALVAKAVAACRSSN
jgi:site-specific DNA-methyltransferase (adenine-specific)